MTTDVGLETLWAGMISGFLTHLRAAGCSPATLRLRTSYLRRVATAYPLLELVTVEDLEAWIAQPGWSPETRKSARAAVTTFCAWATRRGLLAVDPAADLPPVRIPDPSARPAPADVVRATLAAADATGDPRDALMVRLQLLCGLRVHEVAKVRGEDVEGERLRVRGKGGRSRVIDLPPVLLVALRERHGPVFPGRVDGCLSAHYVQRKTARLMPPGWTPHTLRHSAVGAVWEASGQDLFVTQEFAGHAKPETTRRYVPRSPTRLRRAVLAAAETWPDAG